MRTIKRRKCEKLHPQGSSPNKQQNRATQAMQGLAETGREAQHHHEWLLSDYGMSLFLFFLLQAPACKGFSGYA